MFAHTPHINKTLSQNKENALGTAKRTTRGPPLNTKAALNGPGLKQIHNLSTPNPKSVKGSSTKRTLRDITQTPSQLNALREHSKPNSKLNDATKTAFVRRTQRLFGSSEIAEAFEDPVIVQVEDNDELELEYVPQNPSSDTEFLLKLDPEEEFGADIDVGVINRQLSTAKAQKRPLPKLDLAEEPLIDVLVSKNDSVCKRREIGVSRIPRASSRLFGDVLEVKLETLVAHKLQPSKIPHLKRKR